MAENTKIEWCDHTVNLWHGCAKVHTGCKNCYAETQVKRWGFDISGGRKHIIQKNTSNCNLNEPNNAPNVG